MKCIFILSKLVMAIFMIVFYYKWIKHIIFRKAPDIAYHLKLTKKYPVTAAAGVIQLILIAVTHISFCGFLFFLFHIKFIGWLTTSIPLLVGGFFIGVGCMGLSTLFCQMGMMLSQIFLKKYVPTNAKSWLTIARGGWMRHHLHNIEILPWIISFLIILVQISAEEIMFRGIMLNFFLDVGKVEAILISTILFTYMQIFHMPSSASAMFPVFGALVLGMVNGILYVSVPILLPLIIAHLAFFIVAVL